MLTLTDVAERIERAYTNELTGPVAQWFSGLRRTLAPTVRAGGGALPVGAEVHLSPTTTSLLERLTLPRRVHERTGRRVLVVFDEFQDVLAARSNADAVMRSEIQHHADCASYVFAGSHVGMMHGLFTGPKRAFYAQAVPLELPPLPAAETAAFIGARFTPTGKDVGAALGPLLDLTVGHPQRTMLLAHAIWEMTPTSDAADEATAAEAAERVLHDLADEFRELWSRTPVTQRQALTVIAEPLALRRHRSRWDPARRGGDECAERAG